jgi:iron(III) transport system ATP-binding protein
MTCVRCQQITKTFGATVALSNVDLSINAGELFFLLGPSGCGKSTLLRIIAGLQEPTAGRLYFNGHDVTDLPTQKRNAVMCFQSYALWPHMSVRDNIRFGLEVRHLSRDRQRQRVDEVLELVQMTDLADRRPNQLSGGQQQRVALARALAVEPACLLLDEPLSNLDAKLRQEMRTEIRRICKTAGLTTIYVTHDQKEALSVADRIGILRDGLLVQVGTPAQLYHRPCSVFVADFVGQANLLSGKVLDRSGNVVRIDTPAGPIWAMAQGTLPSRVTVSIRPERLRVTVEDPKSGRELDRANRWPGRMVESVFLGETSEHVVDVSGQRLKVIASPPLVEPPDRVALEFGAEDSVVLAE